MSPKLTTCDSCGVRFDVSQVERVMELDGADRRQPAGPADLCPSCFTNEAFQPGWGWSNDYAPLGNYRRRGDRWVLRSGVEREGGKS